MLVLAAIVLTATGFGLRRVLADSPEKRGIILRDPDGDALIDRKFHLPLEDPKWVKGRDATHMRPEDAVVGYLDGDQSWAIPWWILDNHHAANLELNGRPVVITLCERCSSASAFDPVFDGVRHRFKVAGLFNGTIVTRDEESGSLWTPFVGRSIYGPLEGHEMKRLRLDQANWADWLELHPDTLVVFGTDDQRLGHGAGDFAPGVAVLPDGMKRSIQHPDERRSQFEVVLGVTVAGKWRAYPIAELDRAGPVAQDVVEGTPVVVLHKKGTWLAAAFDPTLDGKKLELIEQDGAIVDRATGSVFNVAGFAKTGPLAGKRLTPAVYQLEEWYVWATQHPGTSIWSAAP